ncbi:MAG: hypothetical protein WC385_00785 [Candidatus Paceibacterota bacterium]|jgi:RNA polymerase-binding transcription factor DksA
MALEGIPNQIENGVQPILERLRQESAHVEEALINDSKLEESGARDDQAQVEVERDQQWEIVSNYKERQQEIERAIKWFEGDGKNLTCAYCGQPIEPERLGADAASITCIKDRDLEDSVEI